MSARRVEVADKAGGVVGTFAASGFSAWKKSMGGDVAFLSAKVVLKDSRVDFPSPWHQDWHYWLGSEKTSVWIATAHHFYLTPLLAWIVIRHRMWRPESLLIAANLLLYLVILSRAITPSHLNVNYAYRLLDGVDWAVVEAVNNLPMPIDVLAGTALVVLITMCPTALLLRRTATA